MVYIVLMTNSNTGDDFVQCVPTKKGHQILFKGYTYVFKSRLQCGSEQWCCSYRQKTVSDEPLPDWVSIYFIKNTKNEYRCNICQVTINTTEKCKELMDHIKSLHKEVYDVHKENPEATVGFRIEYLHLNVLKDGDSKNQSVILEEVCEVTAEEIVPPITEKEDELLTEPKKKKTRAIADQENRKRSWVWKYFDRMSNIIFRCTLCNVVLSIKGCNTNNMNRHVRTRHPTIYMMETFKKKNDPSEQLDLTEVETPYAIKTEEIRASEKDIDDTAAESPSQRNRRSWIWLYFDRTSATSARCKLCNRNICHGGNATGNMNRHLKMIHHKTGEDFNWIWKVFENSEEAEFFACKICQYKCMKFDDIDKSISFILHHLKAEHGVVSGDQIITSTDDVEEENTN